MGSAAAELRRPILSCRLLSGGGRQGRGGSRLLLRSSHGSRCCCRSDDAGGHNRLRRHHDRRRPAAHVGRAIEPIAPPITVGDRPRLEVRRIRDRRRTAARRTRRCVRLAHRRTGRLAHGRTGGGTHRRTDRLTAWVDITATRMAACPTVAACLGIQARADHGETRERSKQRSDDPTSHGRNSSF
jgi:hypothetical protein